MKRIEIINGPNLNLTGKREPALYGTITFEQYLETLRARYPDIPIGYYQSNVEGEIINHLQSIGFDDSGIILNAGGYSHTSVAIRDTLLAITAPVIEVHLSNIFAREDYRHHSLISSACKGFVCGLGLQGYTLAVEALLTL